MEMEPLTGVLPVWDPSTPALQGASPSPMHVPRRLSLNSLASSTVHRMNLPLGAFVPLVLETSVSQSRCTIL